mmetsp:Transcript_7248/g.18014  ORF Transcript_7248/g.18014 Transcript_7248/m.18014 type:complete len:176 (-) Transcript_7248:197-724(-)
MANAAAKKAAAARQAAAATYFPIVAALNLGYLFLRLVYQWSSITASHAGATIALVGLSCISYKGILEDHANPIPKGDGKSEALAGGASLDLLGLVVVMQYGTVFISDRLYWLLVVLPLWGVWKIYSTFFGSKGGVGGFMPQSSTGNTEPIADETASENANSKREKRAARRRQKWS